MKKLSALLLAITAMLMFASCGAPGASIQGDSSGFSREVVIVGGDKFDCIFANKNFQHATIDCFKIDK